MKAIMDMEFVIHSEHGYQIKVRPNPDFDGYDDGALITYLEDNEKDPSIRLFISSDVLPFLHEALGLALVEASKERQRKSEASQ